MDSDWQSKIFSIKERVGVLFEKEILTDVSFTFPEEESEHKILRAHKLILAGASTVFFKMFYGDWEANTNKAIQIEDIKSKTFAIFLKYIYTDKIELENWQNLAEVYGVAKKYLVTALAEHCIDLINKKLLAGNVLKIYEFANFYEEEELKNAALKLIKKNTTSVLNSTDFAEIDLTTMLTILDQNELQASELDLYDALEFLAAAQEITEDASKQTNTLDTVGNQVDDYAVIQSKFREAIKKINFLKMTAEQFSSGPAFSKLLLAEEVVAILICLIKPSNINTRYPKDFVQNNRKKRLLWVFFDFSCNGLHIGRIIIETGCHVFLELFTGKRSSFKGSYIGCVNNTDHYFSVSAAYSRSGYRVQSYDISPEDVTFNYLGLGVLLINDCYDFSKLYITTSSEAKCDEKLGIGKVVDGTDFVIKCKSFVNAPHACIENCGVIDYNAAPY